VIERHRLVAYLLVVLAAVGGLAALAMRPAAGAPQDTADYVIVAGAAGLRWDDIDPGRTPTLWQAASRGSVGWLSVRSAHRTTCPADGWLTLGAGNYAAWDTARVSGECPPVAPDLRRPDGIGANLPKQRQVVRDNQDRQTYGAVPGALAESVRCTVAVGPGAAVAAARPFGRVDRYEPTLPADSAKLLSSCVLSIVDLGTVAGAGIARQQAAARADATLARILAARPQRAVVLVAGLADTDSTSRLHVAIADGPGWQGGWLTSAGTGREGYVQLVDLAATVLSVLGRPAPERLLAGKPASSVPGRPDLEQAVAGGRDADRRAGAQRNVAAAFFLLLAVVQLMVFLCVVPVLIRARRHAGPTGPASPPRSLLRGAELLLIAVALAVPAALLADAVPWWRATWPGVVFGLVTVALVAAGTAAIRFLPGYRRTLRPMAAVAAIDVAVVAIDLLTGARLQLNGVVGYSALDGSRYAGVGGVALGVLTAGTLVFAGCLLRWVRKPWRPLVVVLVGGFAVVTVGSPFLGADPVGAIAVTAGVCVAAAISGGGWLTVQRFAWATVAGLAVTIGFAVLDLRRPDAEQGSLGRLLTALGNGTAGPAVQRAAASNARALLDGPLTLVAVVGVLMLLFALFSPWGGLKRVFGLYPAVRAAVAGTTVSSLLAGVLGGSALTVAGAAAATAVPMAVLTALRVLDHAADRTPAPGNTDGPGGPGRGRDPDGDSPIIAPAPVVRTGAGAEGTGKPDAEGLTAGKA
jgi:hypothetical protein